MNAETPYAGQRLDVLDGLRGIAIAMVVWYHLWLITWLSPPYVHLFSWDVTLAFIPVTGFLGVELFFFISGFCLFFPYARTLFEAKPQQSIGTYAYRRAIKILPSYWLLIAVLAVTILPWASAVWPVTLWHIGLHVLFVHNWWHESSGSIAGVLWSLAVEVQFYFIFPLVAAAFMRRPWLTYGVLVIIASAYRLAVQHYDRYDFHFLINQLPAFVDLFGAGMLAAYLFVLGRSKLDWQRFGRRALAVVAISGTALIVMVYHLYAIRYGNDAIFDWQAEYRPVFGAALAALTVASLFAPRWWHAILGNRVLVFLSTISYNLYMWHQIVMMALHDRRWPPYAGTDPHFDHVWMWTFTALALPAAIAVASAITFGFERPLLRRGPRLLLELPGAIGRRLGVSWGERGEAEAAP